MPLSTRPHRLPANKVPVYYAGGAGIDRFRGAAGAIGPEDWVGSVTAFPPALLPDGADPSTGISRLAGDLSLAEAVASDPSGWLGEELSAVYGQEPGLLVKLLDAGERLPVHVHPTREMARAKLGSRFGKTEGWIIMASAPAAEIWLGFRRTVAMEELKRWIRDQDVEAMLAAMNRLAVTEGDVFYLPAGLPHSIGPGVMLTELQEPTSFSILAEYSHFGLTEDQATLGLGWDAAGECFDLGAYDAAALGNLRPPAVTVAESPGGAIFALFPPEAEQFFQAHRAVATGSLALGAAGFRILVVERGEAELAWQAGAVDVSAGQTWVVPYGAGALSLRGDAVALLCAPPASAAAS
jgi:mannose-6-phosphate isomerase